MMVNRNFTISRIIICISLLIFFLPEVIHGQSNNYWTRNFNEESSLLSGAVVGGGSGPSAIYYNPASISEVKASKLSLNASLFSFDFTNVRNALGEDINIQMSRGNIEPRFISYMLKSKRFKKWSFEVAVLNNENLKAENSESVDQQIDILTGLPGDERYFAGFHYVTSFRDDWIGAGGSVRLNERLCLGASMFVTIKTFNYTNSLNIEAYSTDESLFDDDFPFYSASFESYEYLKFNDYRLTWKGGFLYQAETFSIGLSITTPSLGGIYSDGKRVTRKEKQSNITMPGTGEPVPDYLVIDYREKKDVSVSYKTPLSVSAGFIYYSPNRKRTFYSSAEYFFKINTYPMVEASEGKDIGMGPGSSGVIFSEWLTYVNGARPIFNVAQGYSWTLKQGLLLMGGFRTDFNARKNLDYGEYSDYNTVKSINVNLYHMTCGLSWNIFGQDLITGFEYTVGRNKDQRQIASLSDPVEYNPVDKLALQGQFSNTMKSVYNSISIYFGASFNFGEDKK
jgi:hypothetical protein